VAMGGHDAPLLTTTTPRFSPRRIALHVDLLLASDPVPLKTSGNVTGSAATRHRSTDWFSPK
jgi:hypothetical protein